MAPTHPPATFYIYQYLHLLFLETSASCGAEKCYLIFSNEQNTTYFEFSCGMKGGIYKSQPKKWEVSKTGEQKGQHLLWSLALRRWRSNDLGEKSLDSAHLENRQELEPLVPTWKLYKFVLVA